MKLIIWLLLLSLSASSQKEGSVKNKWRLDKNKILTGSLVFAGGSAKGFNETLQFNYPIFEKTFPGANKQWFDPKVSWRNKYEGANPDNGPRFFLSTSALVMFTDQYHLNNFIQRTVLMSALVIKIGDEKKPLKHYLLDMVFYTACYQIGFSSTYYPFTSRKYK
ncbi:MAG TPA: hypothetical protein VI548_05610 [Chitinophagaceae bacterium]|nr:hypothetical protein [Chitinophagaceae bacterium]